MWHVSASMVRHPGATRSQYPFHLAAVQGITFDVLRSAVQRTRMPTSTRVALMEDEASTAASSWLFTCSCFIFMQ